jgi:hypothetical protein
MSWEMTSRGVVLQALLLKHPEIREFIVELKRLKDPEDFAFIFEGTISNLKHLGLIKELPKKPRTMFRGFVLTKKGLAYAKKAVK